MVSFRDADATLRISAIGERAQWFEDNSPIQNNHKKADVTGIDGKVITVVMESGDSSPATPDWHQSTEFQLDSRRAWLEIREPWQYCKRI